MDTPPYIEPILHQELLQTHADLAGAPGAEVAGHAVGAVLAVFTEVFARLEVLEAVVLERAQAVLAGPAPAAVPDPAEHRAEIVEFPAQERQSELPDLAASTVTARDALLRLRAEQVGGQVRAAPAAQGAFQGPPPGSRLALLLEERDRVLARLARLGGVKGVPEPPPAATPAPAAIPVVQTPQPAGWPSHGMQVPPVAPPPGYPALDLAAPVYQTPPGWVQTPNGWVQQQGSQPFPPAQAGFPVAEGEIYEIRHVEGPLMGRPDMQNYKLTHRTQEGAQQVIDIIIASHPGWKDRLAVFDRRLP